MEKKVKVIILILVLLVALGLATHLFLTPSSVKSGSTENITDMINRAVEVPSVVDNVVATSPPMTTVLYMIAPDKLKAVNFQWTDDELKYVPGQYANYPVVGGWYGAQDGSYEEFIAAEPDVVIESIDEGGDGDLSTVEERQEKFGTIPVIAVKDTTNVEKVGESINDEDVLILKNHGVICVADSLKEAKLLAIFVEEIAKTQFITYMLNSVED